MSPTGTTSEGEYPTSAVIVITIGSPGPVPAAASPDVVGETFDVHPTSKVDPEVFMAAPALHHPSPASPEGLPPTPERPPWHTLGIEETLVRLGTGRAGLTDAEAHRRLAEHGPNELTERGGRSPWRIVWEQVTAVMVLILLAAAGLSLALGKLLEAGAIAVIVGLFAGLGFLQEYRAEKAIAALRKLAVPTVRVVRDGRTTELAAVDLVPGDVVLIEAGNVIPADLRLLEAASLSIGEAALTGESEPIAKQVDALDRADVPLGDRRNLAFAGTSVATGRGSGVVVHTGMATELGHIADLLQSVGNHETPLQRRLDRVGKQLALAGVAVAALVVLIGLAGGEPIGDLVLTAISVAVAVIPEGLPAVVTFTLAVGAQRMVRRNALIRRLPAVETLGSVTVICSDKTGTLTQNRMTVTVVETMAGRHELPVAGHAAGSTATPDSGPETATLLLLGAAALCNDGELLAVGDPATTEPGEPDEPLAIGDPTETALLVAARRVGLDIDGLRRDHPRIGELPFDADRKRMTTVHPSPAPGSALAALAGHHGGPIAVVKGAPDRLLALAVAVVEDGRVVPLDGERAERLRAANDELAGRGMRVLAVAFRELDDTDRPGEHGRLRTTDELAGAERDLVLLGLLGIIDPPRQEVRDAVGTCSAAGIRTVMITGDHPRTAEAIAAELGILDADRPEVVLTGDDLDHLSDDDLDNRVAGVSVYARVSPEHKLRIVSALRRRGEVVAMTGDGVNDAPALKQADIGVAMGITGTDVSKEASDMVLRDDNFATIVASVEEGRVIYDNLRRFVRFAVAGNIGKMAVMVGWPVLFLATTGDLGTAAALVPLQLLWLNLMTDGVLGLSMGLEPAEKGVMSRAPHSPDAGIWSGGLGVQAAWVGALIGAVSLGVGFAYERAGLGQWQTMMVMTLTAMQVFQALGSRSDTEPLWRLGWRSNPLVAASVAVVVGLQVLALYSPLRGALSLEPLGATDLAVCVGAGVALLAVMEAAKLRRTRSRP